MELTRSKITVDRLILRQKEGMISALPFGYNSFGSLYERVLPASSVANLYPLNYSGKTDEKGFTLVGTSLARIFWWISISGVMTKPTLMC